MTLQRKTKKQKRRIGVYLRVSTDKQVQVFEGSLESQKFRMVEFVKMMNMSSGNWGEIEKFYIEEGYSAGTDRRPEYQRLLSDIRKEKIDLILVADLSRLSRSIEDFCALQRYLEKHNAAFFSMKEQFDTSTPAGRMMVNIMVTMGQFEREQTAERVAINCHSRAIRGYMNGGRPILGYSRHPEKKGMLVVNEEEAPIVRTIFKTFLEQGTRSKTIKELHRLHIFPKRNSNSLKSQDETASAESVPSLWTTQSLGNILNQAAYIGYKEVNKSYRNRNPDTLKPWQQFQIVKASWPAIIDEKTFYEVQKILEEANLKERERLSGAQQRTFFLSNLMKCGECGRALVGQSAHGKTGNIHRYYYHSRKFAGHECSRPRLHANALEDKFLNHLREGLKASGYARKLEETFIECSKSKGQDTKHEKKRVEKELKHVKDQIAGIWRLQAARKMSEEALKSASEELNSLAMEKTNLENRLLHLQEEESLVNSIQDQVKFVEQNLNDLIKGWAKSTNAMKKRLLRRAIKQITVTRDEMRVTFWLSADERDGTNSESLNPYSNDGAKILEFRRHSRRAAVTGEDHNLLSVGSPIRKIGRGRGT